MLSLPGSSESSVCIYAWSWGRTAGRIPCCFCPSLGRGQQDHGDYQFWLTSEVSLICGLLEYLPVRGFVVWDRNPSKFYQANRILRRGVSDSSCPGEPKKFPLTVLWFWHSLSPNHVEMLRQWLLINPMWISYWNYTGLGWLGGGGATCYGVLCFPGTLCTFLQKGSYNSYFFPTYKSYFYGHNSSKALAPWWFQWYEVLR